MESLQQLCDNIKIEFIESYIGLLLASGELPESYYTKDKDHLNNLERNKEITLEHRHRITKQISDTCF